ncbi:F-box domain-containing protein [Favolaschia claudopus]|uniref:F-box domain-containing protein n=1 Tax=Favolaschia claudopus TaxID=2862362 RepID=A0AAW0ANK5_9AGAR
MLDSLAVDRAFLAENDAQILDLEVQIAAIEQSISSLRAVRQPVQERLDSYKYPVLTLPNEIITEIFVHFLPTYPQPPPLVGTLFPTCLTQICCTWRAIALATPPLWRAIDLTDQSDEEPGMEATLALARLWSARSGSYPLSIDLADDYELHYILPIVLPHRDRLEHLTFNLDRTELLSIIQGSFPLLRNLSIRFSCNVSGATVTLQNLPLLRTAVLDDWLDPHAMLPWSQLTSLTLRCLTTRHCREILRQASHLIRCNLYFAGDMIPNEQNQDQDLHIELLRLETLTFEPRSRCDGDFFRCLVTPALLSLQLSEPSLGLASESDSFVVDSLASFISKSGCQLRELKVTNTHVNENVYREAFPSIPIISVDEERS